MTLIQALQSMLEYENDNLLAKALIDRGLSASATYALADQAGVELAAADIYLILANHPEFREGSKFIKYSTGALLTLRREILKKHNVAPATVSVPLDSRNQKLW